ncbi:MAG: family 78 glycoside hydrolase catalytic domain [Bacteroidota bacterium]|nr:family 78 glycoside hydrolase catalytic domain [Bacteroidota bacterium]
MKAKFWNVRYWVVFALLSVSLGYSQHINAQMIKVENLRVEYKNNPIGLDVAKPRLSWEIVSKEKGVMQTAFQVRAALLEADLKSDKKLVWNSGKIASDQSIQLEYNGLVLKSGQRVYWQVKVWDNKGHASEWSSKAFFEMGLLSPAEWKAWWIEPNLIEKAKDSNPCPYLRKEFSLKGKVAKAVIYATAHGLYQLNLNGQKVSDQLFTPGWTSYNKHLLYQTYDVTNQVKTGANAFGVILGDGWYRGLMGWEGKRDHYGSNLGLLLQMKVTYADGSEEWVMSDKTWKASTGAILLSEIYAGETYDARLEKDGWDKPGFNDAGWNGVTEKNLSKEHISAFDGSPVRVTETIKPIKKFITPKGETVFDLGQNMVGWVQFKLKGAAGTKITLRHAEVLDKDGNFYTDNLRTAKCEDSYTFKGDGVETFEPHFTFHGFRYIQVKDYPGEVTVNDIAGRVIHSDMEPIGNFECSDSLVNRLQKNIQWGQRGNFLDIPTDCPQRDERLGWTGDAQVFSPTACYNMNAAPFFTKWMKDFTADQRPNGSVPWVVPMIVEGGGGTGWSDGYGATGWADAAVIIPWSVYQAYGDKKILENQYASMKSWVDYMRKEAGNGYLFNTGFHFGDWLSFAEYYSYYYNAPDYGYAGAYTEKDLIATAYFYYSSGLLQKMSEALGKTAEANDLAQLRVKIKGAFKKEFVTSTGRLTSGSQTAYILALAFGIMPDDMRETAAKRLGDDVKHFGHLTTGFLGTPLICQALTDNGYPDIAYMLLFNKRYPSWLYPVTKGATTIWERWDCIKPDGTFQDVGMNSFNHYAYGAVGQWLYSRVAGLNIDPENPGYKHIIIKPVLTDKLTFARADQQSMYGKVVSGWKRTDSKVTYHVVIPVNTTATIMLPAINAESVSESNLAVNQSKSVKYLKTEDGRVIVEAGSGEYFFEVK